MTDDDLRKQVDDAFDEALYVELDDGTKAARAIPLNALPPCSLCGGADSRGAFMVEGVVVCWGCCPDGSALTATPDQLAQLRRGENPFLT